MIPAGGARCRSAWTMYFIMVDRDAPHPPHLAFSLNLPQLFPPGLYRIAING